jgi:N-acetylglucosaminyl-diphospho-decaprenol L-rhamnosyltransferase
VQVDDRSVDVAAVIVTHESASLVPSCLDSLAAQAADMALTVIVADSGSTDEVEPICRGRGAIFLAGPNRGFGAAVNRALGHEAARQARYVLAMNPDVEIADGSLADFVASCDQRPECGIFAPRQVDQHRRLIYSIGREPSPASYWRDWRTGWPTWEWNVDAYEREARCEWVMGAFMLVRRQVMEALGGFDERFFLYSEDVDLCTRARRAGWEIAFLPELTITHSRADQPLDEHRERLLVWSRLLYMRKWYGRRERASMRMAMVARITRQLLRRLRWREDARGAWASLSAALRFRRRRYRPW